MSRPDVDPVTSSAGASELLLPDPVPSRREVDRAQRALLMLAARYPEHRMRLLQSEMLLRALETVLADAGTFPEDVVQLIVAPGPPDSADPVASLVTRCRLLPTAATPGPRPDAGPDPLAVPPSPGLLDRPAPTVLGPVTPAGAPGTVRPSAPVALPVSDAPARPGPVGRREGASDPRQTGFVPRRTARVRERTASRGWRGVARRMSGGTLRVGPGPDERLENSLIARVQTPISGFRHIVVLSLKGGSGKTTTTVMLGHTFASHRRDRVAAIDASPDAGTLAFRIADEPMASVRTLLDSADSMRRYVDVRSVSGHAASRLDIIASDVDPTVTRPFSATDYSRAAEILTRFHSLVLTDCGAGLMHDAMSSVLDSADQIVLVMTPAVDGARSADLTLDWLDAHDYSDLVRGAVAVVNGVRRRPVVDLAGLRSHFAARCRAVVEIPVDAHLEEGASTELARLHPTVRRSYLHLAAVVADGFEDGSVRRGRTA